MTAEHKEILWLAGRLCFFAALPAAVMLIPTSAVEQGPTLCLIKNLTGHDCPGCGLTRAFPSVAHFEFRRAWQFNRLVVVVLPLVGWLWARAVYSDFYRLRSLLRRK